MWKILIDSTKRFEAKISLIQTLDNQEKVVAEKTGDIDLVVTLAEILHENNLRLSDIAEFSSNLGPGSFTGLRNSTTVINVLNWALGKKTIDQLKMPNYGAEPNITPRKHKQLN